MKEINEAGEDGLQSDGLFSCTAVCYEDVKHYTRHHRQDSPLVQIPTVIFDDDSASVAIENSLESFDEKTPCHHI